MSSYDESAESAATDVDALSSSEGGSCSDTDIQGYESGSVDSYSDSDDSDASTYSKLYASSTTSTDDLPNWAAIKRRVLQLGCCT